MSQNDQRLPYMPQLDGLRAIAVLSVMLVHFVPEWGHTKGIPWGALGVWMFFVISGFLITSILIGIRDGGRPRRSDMVRFYKRRALRLLPIFYLTILVGFVFNIAPIRETIWWHVSYASNLLLFFHGRQGPVGHFWSLAVEEQFYFLWPWVVVFTPSRMLTRMSIGLIGLGMSFLIVARLLGLSDFQRYVFTLTAFIPLGVGSLLASTRSLWTAHPRMLSLIAATGLLALAFIASTNRLTPTQPFWFALVFAYLVGTSALGKSAAFLAARPIVYIGKISYGLYVYHNFVPLLGRPLFGPRIDPLMFMLISFGIAVASWHLIESPLQQLKNRKLVQVRTQPAGDQFPGPVVVP